MSRRRARTLDDYGLDEAVQIRACDHPGCDRAGEYRAPRSRTDLRSYYHFCLDHVRAYNLSWDYFADMSTDQIENVIRRSTVWERPSWPFGSRPANAGPDEERVADPFGFFRPGGEAHQAQAQDRPRFSATEERALAVLEVEPPITKERVKARYKALVKRHHPDANGGDKASEERLKKINEAYSTLKAAALP
ncbi:MAG: J domain-containing protein [Alphaproteobacteria bacterium]